MSAADAPTRPLEALCRSPTAWIPSSCERLVESRGGELAVKMEIDFLELSASHSVARMPVAGNRQVVGLLHGGAHVVLGESLGSVSSAIHAGPGRYAVGIEINATHSRSATEGFVTATCDALVLGPHAVHPRDRHPRRGGRPPQHGPHDEPPPRRPLARPRSASRSVPLRGTNAARIATRGRLWRAADA